MGERNGWGILALGFEIGKMGIPDTRGGGPEIEIKMISDLLYSPQVWGWTGRMADRILYPAAFPTGVGWTAPE